MDALRGLPLKEMYDAIEEQLSLTDRQQMIFTCYYRRGLTLQEIADCNDLDIQAVQRELKRINHLSFSLHMLYVVSVGDYLWQLLLPMLMSQM